MYRVTFLKDDNGFAKAVKYEVQQYFIENDINFTGNWRLYLKAMFFISASCLIYLCLLIASYSWWQGMLLCFLLGLLLAGIAMNVMHDACHESFSSNKRVNNIMALSMNALGSNAFLWKIKHNIIHHTYTNIPGVDSDIENWPLLRQSPAQHRLRFHLYQHVYMFLLYAITTLHWMLILDFEKYFTRRFAATSIHHISLKEHLLFWFSKCMYGIFYIAIPVFIVGWQSWLIGFLLIHITMGVVLIIVFQLAHLVEKVSIDPVCEEGKIASGWFVHELKTTAGFAQQNRLLTWYFGGLNFQVEHHLFPRISHIHYPAISVIIRQQCKAFKLPYHSYDTLVSAIQSHIRLMKSLGAKDSR